MRVRGRRAVAPRLFGWGQLETGPKLVPELVPDAPLAGLRSLAAGFGSSWALEQSGRVVRLGSSEPVAAPEGVVALASGLRHLVMVTAGGDVFVSGLNALGVAGEVVGEDVASRLSAWVAPRRVAVPARISQVAASAYDHVLALDGAAGRVFAWGNDAEGQCSGSVANDVSPVVEVALPRPATRVFGGPDASFAVTDDGRLLAWGLLGGTRLGGVTALPPLPGGAAVSDVGCGSSLYVLDARGSLWRLDKSEWQLFATGVATFAVGLDFGALISAESRTLQLWGRGSGGVLANGAKDDSVAANPFAPAFFVSRAADRVVLGPSHGLAVLLD